MRRELHYNNEIYGFDKRQRRGATYYTLETGMDWTGPICRKDGSRTPRKTLDQAKYMVVE